MPEDAENQKRMVEALDAAMATGLRELRGDLRDRDEALIRARAETLVEMKRLSEAVSTTVSELGILKVRLEPLLAAKDGVSVPVLFERMDGRIRDLEQTCDTQDAEIKVFKDRIFHLWIALTSSLFVIIAFLVVTYILKK